MGDGELHIYGFLINNQITIDIENRRMFSLTTPSEQNKKFTSLKIYPLNETQACLLLQILVKGKKEGFVNRDEVLKEVWDERGLISSSQVLWSTMKDVKSIFKCMGIPDDLISCNGCTGYIVNSSLVKVLIAH